MKFCSRCQKTLPIGDFVQYRVRISSYCRKCQREYFRVYYQSHCVDILTRRRLRYSENSEVERLRTKHYRMTHHEQVLAYERGRAKREREERERNLAMARATHLGLFVSRPIIWGK